MLGITYPKIIKNTKVYNITKATPWSKTIDVSRLRWFGHMTRLPSQTPVKHALGEAERKIKKKVGGQKLTWLTLMKKQLKDIGLDYKQAQTLAMDREKWKRLISDISDQYGL